MRLTNDFVPPTKKKSNLPILNVLIVISALAGLAIWVNFFNGEGVLFKGANLLGTIMAPPLLIVGLIIIGWISIYYFWYLPKKAIRAFKNRQQ